MRSAPFLLVATLGCTDPVPSQISVPSSLDAPLELHYDESIDPSILDSLSLVHDGIVETGRIETDGTIARFWPDHGWYAAATYQATLDGVDAWSFDAPARWHLVGESPAGCGDDTWDPQVAAGIDGDAWVLATGDRSGCVLEHSTTGWQPARALGTRAVDTLDRGSMYVADDGSGFLVHAIDDQTEVVDLASGAMVAIGTDVRATGALSPGGVGLVGWAVPRYSPGGGSVKIRPIDSGVVGPELVIQSGDVIAAAVATSDAGVRAVVWNQWDATPNAHLFLAVERGDGMWKGHEIRQGGANVIQDIAIAAAEDGWVYVTWREVSSAGEQIWGFAEAADRSTPPTRLDGGAQVFQRTGMALQSRWGHTGLAWLEKPEENRLGKVGTRIARDGAWGEIEWSTDAVEPYLELHMAIDAKGHFAFTWENGDLVPCAARKQGSTWTEFCELPSPNFTAPSGSVAVNARGRAYVSVFTGRSIQIAAFD